MNCRKRTSKPFRIRVSEASRLSPLESALPRPGGGGTSRQIRRSEKEFAIHAPPALPGKASVSPGFHVLGFSGAKVQGGPAWYRRPRCRASPANIAEARSVKPNQNVNRSERQPYRKLPESPLVMVRAGHVVRAQPALKRRHRNGLRHGITIRVDCHEASLVQCQRVNVEIVMVENVESFRPELQLEAFRQRKRLGNRQVKVPGARPSKRIPSRHVGGIRSEIGDRHGNA